MQSPKQKQTRRGKRKTPCCHTGCMHTPNPNAPPDPDPEGVPWGTSDTTDKSIKYTNFDAESTELSCMPLIYWSTQTTAEINLLQPEEEPSTKEKDGIYGRSWKRDHSSMVTAPQRPQSKRSAAGARSNIYGHNKQSLATRTTMRTRQVKDKRILTIKNQNNNTSRPSKRQRRK